MYIFSKLYYNRIVCDTWRYLTLSGLKSLPFSLNALNLILLFSFLSFSGASSHIVDMKGGKKKEKKTRLIAMSKTV